jgi:Spy/CpxP family protein refolding chaperone
MGLLRILSLLLIPWLSLGLPPPGGATPPAGQSLPPQVVKALALTGSQQQRLLQLRNHYQPRIQAIRAETQRQRQALSQPLQDGDRQRLQQQVRQAQVSLTQLQSEVVQQLRQLLTPTQQQKLALMLTGSARPPKL